MSAAARASESGSRRPHGWTDPLFASIAEVARLGAGLTFSPNRQPSAEAGMRRAMSSLRLRDARALLDAVAVPGEARDALLAELTVGESYFFRDAPPLALRLSELVAERRDRGGPVRIWSAGCASGEEPYTIALMLRELHFGGRVRILATDIARPRLDAARRARYTPWALRGVSEERVQRWFTKRGAHFILDPVVRDAVEFGVLNLADGEYSSPETGTEGQDLVVCRNVLIYFELSTVASIASRLLASLHPDGWLLLGPSDPPLTGLVPCTVVMTREGVAYRRLDAPPVRASSRRTALGDIAEAVARGAANVAEPIPSATCFLVPPLAPLPSPPETSPAEPIVPTRSSDDTVRDTVPARDSATAYARGDHAAAAMLAGHELAGGAGDPRQWQLWIRAVANQGDLATAGELSSRALDHHRLDPELHYLHGLLLLEAGRHAESAQDARRALYLERDFIMGHLLLGDALVRGGERRPAARSFENALALLAASDDAAEIPAADGMSVLRLRQIVAQCLSALDLSPR